MYENEATVQGTDRSDSYHSALRLMTERPSAWLLFRTIIHSTLKVTLVRLVPASQIAISSHTAWWRREIYFSLGPDAFGRAKLWTIVVLPWL
jgi:hypothetical protein